MTNFRVAVPTRGDLGLKDTVSDVFSRAETFTLLDVEGGEVKEVRVQENTASSLKQGAGPMVAKSLSERGVDVVLTGELGPGAKTLLEVLGIRIIRVKTGEKVSEALKKLES